MFVVDVSALVAVLLREESYQGLRRALISAEGVVAHPIQIVETVNRARLAARRSSSRVATSPRPTSSSIPPRR